VHAAAICYPERLKRFRAMPGAQEHNPATGQVGPFEEIAGYRLLRLLGYGGFAHTFLAEKGGARFALKLLNELPSGPAATRFEREVEALQLEHRNLVRYEDSGIASYGGLTRPYIAMPYVPGATLRDRIDGAPRSLPPDRLRAIGAEVADGLAFLHEHNVAHRDLTPKNVFLTEAGGVLIIDFGLARLQDRTSLTMKGQMLGTLAYCSPEQLRNETDLHTDLYGLGATLYHALTGQPPFEATSLPALVEMIRSEVPEPPSLRNPSVPDDLDDLVLALLAKEPVQRPTSALAVAESLRAPAGRRARPEPYDRDSPPLLAVRATTPSAARAILGAAMTGEVPDLALAAITAPRVLDELGRAASFDPRLHVAVDTKVETTAGLAMPKAVRSRPYAPEDGVPYRHEQLRDPDRAKRLARGDIAEQHGEGATVFRSPGFPFSGIHDPWIKRDVRLLSDALHARDVYDAEARLFATIRCDIDVLARREDRISIANRFARGTPSGYWVELYGLSPASDPSVTAAAFDLFLLLQEQGVPAIGVLPGPLVELAWSVGIAGAEVKLGRVGGAGAATVRTPTHGRQPPRFEFTSIFDSLDPDDAEALLKCGLLPESDCRCPSCRLAETPASRVAGADNHDLSCRLALRAELGELEVGDRVERLRDRFAEAESLLAAARRARPGNRRFSARGVRNLAATLDLLGENGVLAPMGALRHPAA
jgi:hypothetical protein